MLGRGGGRGQRDRHPRRWVVARVADRTGGRTLLAIQDLTRVAAQRRLGDHETRLRVDVAGYREKRRQALERFAATVAAQVKESGVARSLDPMPSADRKVLHDALAAIEGVSSRSEGEDPNRRVVVAPA